MKKHLTLIMAAALMLLSPAICSAQMRLYTKKARMDDFTTKTTKVVASGQDMIALAIQEEIRSRWHVSPYEFCSMADYERLKEDNNYYFLLLEKEDGIIFLNLSKGGKEKDPDKKKTPFEVVRIPVIPEDNASGVGFTFIGPAVDVIQQFALDAMESDRVGYTGLKAYKGGMLRGKTVILDPEKAEEALATSAMGTVAGVVIAPSIVSFRSNCYKMLVTTDTHELVYYISERYSNPSQKTFSEKEANFFSKKHGNVVR